MMHKTMNFHEGNYEQCASKLKNITKLGFNLITFLFHFIGNLILIISAEF